MGHCYFLLLLLLLLLVLYPLPLLSSPARFRKSSRARRTSHLSWSNDITLLGDASIHDGALSLTSAAAGRAVLFQPVRLLDPLTFSAASFRTRFTFVITPRPNSSADGLAFLLAADPGFLGSAGGFFGLLSPNHMDGRVVATVAIEFDAHYDPFLRDINDNHVAVDVGSIFSSASANATGIVNLKSGRRITAWVEYNTTVDTIRVWASYADGPRPRRPLLKAVRLGLAGRLWSLMYVGFSASCNGIGALHVVESWSFRTSGFPGSSSTTLVITESASCSRECEVPSLGSGGPFTNVSCNAIPPSVPPPEISPEGNKKARKSRKTRRRICASKLLCGALISVSLAVVIVLGNIFWYVWKKRRCRGTSDDHQPVRISLHELAQATSDFRIVLNGQGADAVYLGNLPSGHSVAVKRLGRPNHPAGNVSTDLSDAIARGRHPNLALLRGWCRDDYDDLLLVYDYVSTLTLDSRLHSPQEQAIPWSGRMRIVLGLASAIIFLHEETKVGCYAPAVGEIAGRCRTPGSPSARKNPLQD